MTTEIPLSVYHIFNTVAEAGNISTAARTLFISQPAISKSIKKLEETLNVTLFVRNSRGVKLTEEGKLLYSYTKEAFRSLSEAETTIKHISSLGIGHIRIGVSTTLCKYLLLPYLKEFTELFPNIRITILCQSTFQTIELLKEEKIDIGLIGQPESTRHLEFLPAAGIEDVFVASDTYLNHLNLRESRPLTKDQLFSSATLMLLDEKNITRMYINQYLANNRITAGQILEVSSMDLLIEFAKTGLGIACVIKEFIKNELEDGLLRIVPLSFPIQKRQVGFAWQKDNAMSESLQKFIQFVTGHQKM